MPLRIQPVSNTRPWPWALVARSMASWPVARGSPGAKTAPGQNCITPEPAADGFYMDYGPLLDAMRGKRWVLTARCVNAVTPGLGVNLFEVPGGYALPVTFGGKAASARVRLRNCPGLDRVRCKALHPGAAGSVPVPANFKDEVLGLQVPLKRGCAMVRLTNSSWSGPVDFGKGTGHNHDDGFRATRWAFRSTLARACLRAA